MEYNALIREYSGKSLKVLARVLVSDLKDFPEDWKVYKPVKNGFPITVRTIDGKSFEIFVSSTDTLRLLKLKIFQADDTYPPDVQELHVNLKHKSDEILMPDWFTMANFSITKTCTVYLKVDNKALEKFQCEVKFKPINVKRTYVTSYAHFSAPSWLRYAAGMNFSGLCSNNASCESKELGVEREVVVRPFPYGELYINLACTTESPLICQACSKSRGQGEEKLGDVENAKFHIVPNKLIISKARCLMFWKHTGEEFVHKLYVQSKLGEPAEICHVESKVEHLEITTVEPWRSPYVCVRCDVRIMFKVHEYEMPCGHHYHDWCKPSVWSGMKCKVCHAQVLIADRFDKVLNFIL